MLYCPGETVRIFAFAFNPFKSPREADIHFAMVFPDRTLRFLPTLATDYQEGRISFVMPSDTSIPETPLFELVAGDAVPTGSCTLYAAMTEPGTLEFIAPLWTASFWVARPLNRAETDLSTHLRKGYLGSVSAVGKKAS